MRQSKMVKVRRFIVTFFVFCTLFLWEPMSILGVENMEVEDVTEVKTATVRYGTLGDNDGFLWIYDENTKTLTVTGEDTGLEGVHYVWQEGFDVKSPFDDIAYDMETVIFQDCTFIGSLDSLFQNMQQLKIVKFIDCDSSKVTSM